MLYNSAVLLQELRQGLGGPPVIPPDEPAKDDDDKKPADAS